MKDNYQDMIVTHPDGKTYKIYNIVNIEYDTENGRYKITWHDRMDTCIGKFIKGSRIEIVEKIEKCTLEPKNDCIAKHCYCFKCTEDADKVYENDPDSPCNTKW